MPCLWVWGFIHEGGIDIMNKIDKLLLNANDLLNPALTDFDMLKIDNPYLDKTYLELLEMMDGSHEELILGSMEWAKFVYAMTENQEMIKPTDEEIYHNTNIEPISPPIEEVHEWWEA